MPIWNSMISPIIWVGLENINIHTDVYKKKNSELFWIFNFVSLRSAAMFMESTSPYELCPWSFRPWTNVILESHYTYSQSHTHTHTQTDTCCMFAPCSITQQQQQHQTLFIFPLTSFSQIQSFPPLIFSQFLLPLYRWLSLPFMTNLISRQDRGSGKKKSSLVTTFIISIHSTGDIVIAGGKKKTSLSAWHAPSLNPLKSPVSSLFLLCSSLWCSSYACPTWNNVYHSSSARRGEAVRKRWVTQGSLLIVLLEICLPTSLILL